VFDSIRISPSILSADFMNLEDDVHEIEKAGADWVHVDVMDGHFVPNLTMGVPFVKQLKTVTSLPLDVHLMIDNPLHELPWFIDCLPSLITVHLETLDDTECHTVVEMLHEKGIKAGIALKPDTSLDRLDPTLGIWDMVLIMSVYPGFSGQSYISRSTERVADLSKRCRIRGLHPLIQVDGGISGQTAGLVCAGGADTLVAGSAIFGASDRAHAIDSIRAAGTVAQKGGSLV
jgi:ribulose-phosphate 3-epimerase